jgi:putative ABC transport system substrate-binding protein
MMSAASAATVLPGVARAQQAMPVVGFLNTESPKTAAHRLSGFLSGLKEAGFVDRKNAIIEYRWAEGDHGRIPAMAADLVQRRVAVIVAAGGAQASWAAKSATTTIPIVFISGGDPVRLGLVASLARPGGNVTGVSFFNAALTAKGLQLLHQIVPQVRTVGLLFNPKVPESARQPADAQEAARALGLDLFVANASTEADLEPAFDAMVQRGVGAVVIGGDPFFGGRLEQLAAICLRRRLPASYVRREFPDAGGLMGYGNSVSDAYRQAGLYAVRILKGDRPESLPVMQSTKFEFVINLKTVRALGLEVPPGVSAMADGIIE